MKNAPDRRIRKQPFPFGRLAFSLGVCIVFASCGDFRQAVPDTPEDLAELAYAAPFLTDTERPHPVPPSSEIVARLEAKKAAGETDHLHLLVEYGLRVHWKYLQTTGLARELPLEANMMLSELIRITGISRYATAHEAGWLNAQFDGRFDRTGWSSYQIYIWVKENMSVILSDDKMYPNWKRIGEILEAIDNSSLNGVGGDGVCHYGCV